MPLPRRRYADTVTGPVSGGAGASRHVAPSLSGITLRHGASTAYHVGALYTLYAASRRSAGGGAPVTSTRRTMRGESFSSPTWPSAVVDRYGSVSRRR